MFKVNVVWSWVRLWLFICCLCLRLVVIIESECVMCDEFDVFYEVGYVVVVLYLGVIVDLVIIFFDCDDGLWWYGDVWIKWVIGEFGEWEFVEWIIMVVLVGFVVEMMYCGEWFVLDEVVEWLLDWEFVCSIVCVLLMSDECWVVYFEGVEF